MKVLKSLKDLNQYENSDIVVTVGNFDGVHLGHQYLLKKIKQACLEKKCKMVVFTFYPHPYQILSNNFKNYLITQYEDKKNLLQQLGIDYLVELNFDRDFSTKKPEEFLQDYLWVYPRIKEIHVGHDFFFGINKTGNFELIKNLSMSKNITVHQLDRYLHEGTAISSSAIRQEVNLGNIKKANKFLGRNFSLIGRVIKGDGRGKKIGFPTANINYDKELIIPAKGVYITQTHLNGMKYNSVTNIGSNPTFKDADEINVETYILDFNHDIYGESIKVEFYDKIRNEKKFDSVNQLVDQIKNDVIFANEFFKK